MISSPKPWTENDDAYLRQHYLSSSASQCAAALGRTPSSIWHRAERLGLRKPRCRIDMEKVRQMTPEVAYALGIMWADGHLDDYRIGVGLITSDMRETEPTLRAFGEWNVHDRKPPKPTWKEVRVLRSGDPEFVALLRETDYEDKSTVSPTKILSHVPPALRHLFWRGFFDGDGSIHVYEGHRFGKVTFAGSFEQDWKDLEELLVRLGATYKISRITSPQGHRQSKVVLSNKKSVSAFCDYIYATMESDFIGLSRKHARYLDLKRRQQGDSFVGRATNGRFQREPFPTRTP